MDFSTVMTKAQNALRTKLALKLTVVLLAAGWLVYPQASIWQHAGQGVAVAGVWLRGAVIRGLGGDPHVERPVVASVELDQLKGVKGIPASEVRCLALAIYFEAGREPPEAQLGVGQIALNRARSTKPPQTICRTVYHGLNLPTGCLFEATCRNVGVIPAPGTALTSAIEFATELVSGAGGQHRLAGATHFHERRMRPAWARPLYKVASIGRLEFYGAVPVVEISTTAQMAQPAQSDAAADSVKTAPRRPASSRGADKGSSSQQADTAAQFRKVFGID